MQQFHFTLKGLLKRCRQEYRYYTRRPWTLEDVGRFWDTVEDYDEVNEKIYPYFRRFTNSFDLAQIYLPHNDYTMLDLQARSGKASLFWHEQEKIKESTCCDFSDYLLSLTKKRLDSASLKYRLVKVLEFPLPFEDQSFNLVCSYETIEHVFDYETFMMELARVMTADGIMILTCPSVSWEWVHWLSAAININHSEGPHRFLRRTTLLRCFDENDLDILKENSTIFLPFNRGISIKFDRWLEKHLPIFLRSVFGLRRTFVLRKAT